MVTSGFMSCYRLQWQEEETIEEGLHCLATKLVIKSNKKIFVVLFSSSLCVQCGQHRCELGAQPVYKTQA